MGFLSNLANAVPGVGHIKGLYHYVKGEEEEGDEAMYQSTRSLAVVAGGIAGGPPGAIAAGMATDAAASALMGEEKGIVESCKNIGEDLALDRNPTRSMMNAGLQLGFDGISGYGGGSSGGPSTSSAFGTTMKRGAGPSIQKSARISAVEIAKMGGRQSAKRLATNTAQRGLGIASHIGFKAALRSDLKRQEERGRDRCIREIIWSERELAWESSEEEQESEWEEEQEGEWEEEQESKWEEEQESNWWQSREREWYRRKIEEGEIELAGKSSEEEHESKWWQSRYSHIEEECKSYYDLFVMVDQSENKQNNQSEQQKSKKQEESEKKEQRANSGKQNRNSSGSTSVSQQPPQPPQGNKDNNKKDKKSKELSFFEKFLALLKTILYLVYGNESEKFSSIFQQLSKEDRKYLAKVLKPLVSSGTLEAVIELVIRMFKQHFPKDISYLNFVSLLEFIQTYVTDELKVRNLISNGTETADAELTPEERREKIISEIVSEKDIIQKLIEQFEEVKVEIAAETETWNEQFPNFRDIFAAVYHYFKHRTLPHDGRILSVKEYYDWIRKYLKEIEQNQKLTELKKSEDQTYVRQLFEPQFRRRFKIVLKSHEKKIVLSSAYVVTAMLPDDKEQHVIFLVADILAMCTAVYLLYTFRNFAFNSLLLVLSLPLSISICFFNCIVFIVSFLLNTLLFLLLWLIFILKVLLNMLLLVVFCWYLFFYLPDQR